MPVFRYAVGATLIVAVSTGIDYTLSHITAVLALGFMAPGVPPLSIRSGLGFLFVVVLACLMGWLFAHLFLDYPVVLLLLLSLALLHLYYTVSLNPIFKVWLILALVLIPLISQQAQVLGDIVAVNLIVNAAMAVFLLWVIFLFFPYHPPDNTGKPSHKDSLHTPKARFRTALQAVIVILPPLVAFYIFQWSGAILVLVFIVLLSMNPASTNLKSGVAMIIANLAGGLSAILVFNLLVVVPAFVFFLLLTLLFGLFYGRKLYSGKPIAKLYGTAFSTFLLVLGTVTTSDGDAGEKVWSRIFQIGAAVIYVVLAFGLLTYFSRSSNRYISQ
jgi:hypothetical protein